MSDVENAVPGAEAAPAPEEKQVEQVQQQEPATAEPETPSEEPQRDEKGRFTKRINELTREKWEARRQAEAMQQELQALRQEFERLRQPPPPNPQEDPEAYVAHLAREEARRLLESERSQWTQHQEQQRIQSLAAKYAEREQAYAAQHPDYLESVEQFVAVVGQNRELAEVLMESEHGPQVAHYLGKNLDEAARIASLPPHLAAAQIARIEAKVAAPRQQKTTQAPNPPPVLGGSAVVQKDPAKMSYADYKKWREKGG